MKSVKSHRKEKEEEDEEMVSRRGLSFNNKDAKDNDKADAIRSKHSVTEQRRRCKINERFQILRDLIPNSEQKRDTASFLLEVIEYVQYLQEKVQKYEESHQEWSVGPTKLMPWRNSHWRVQSLVEPTQGIKNDSAPFSTFPENDITSSLTIQQNPIESDPSRCPSGKIENQQPESANKAIALPIPLHASVSSSGQCDVAVPRPLHMPISDEQSTGFETSVALTQQEDLIVEGGRISLTSKYSQGLLRNLTQALQCAGIDLSQATISVQIDIGKQAHRRLSSGVSSTKDPENTSPSRQPIGHFRDAKELDQTKKRLKI